MRGREQRRSERSRGQRWFAASAGLVVAGATVLAMTPAHASPATVNAQLSLSGVATKANILGGDTVGVHPGDTVDFTASPAPTAGLENVPTLGSLLQNVLGLVTSRTFQVVVTFGSNVPSYAGKSVTLGGSTSGPCAGKTDIPITFAKADTYAFTWKVQYVAPGLLGLGCTKQGLNSTDLNALAAAGVTFNAANSWKGQIVAADDPPKGGISIELPSVSVQPKVGPVQLPPVTVPGVTLPTIPVTIPTLPGGPTTGSDPGSGGGGNSGPGYTPPGLSIPEQVVPNGGGNDGGTINGFGNALPNLGSGSGNGGSTSSGAAANSSGGTLNPSNSTPQAKAVELAANPSPSAQMPVLLAIIAIIALSLVTATYARLYLLRRNS